MTMMCSPGTVPMTAEPLPGSRDAVTTASSPDERYGTVAHRPAVRPRRPGYQIVDAQKTGARVAPDFDDFYATHFRGITVQVYAYFGNMSDAQDVTQEAFCRAFSRWAKIAGYDDPVAWVRRVAWNLATSKWRRMRTAMNFARKHREEHAPEPSPDHVALTAALKTLPERQRRAIVMHYLADLSVADIARQENVAEGTVKSWLHRARLALAEQLAERAGERSGPAAPVTPLRPAKRAAKANGTKASGEQANGTEAARSKAARSKKDADEAKQDDATEQVTEPVTEREATEEPTEVAEVAERTGEGARDV
jgi:RNA polymerase sigma-70 factor (ECF subfamily)